MTNSKFKKNIPLQKTSNTHILDTYSPRFIIFLLLIFFGLNAYSAASAQDKVVELDACKVCTESIGQRIKELQEIKTRLDKGYMTDKNLDLLIKWKERFRIDIKKCKLEDEIAGLLAGGATSILGSLLVSVETTVAGAGLASTGYAILIYYIGVEYYNAIYNINSWKIIDQNTAIYQWLVDYLEFGRVNTLDNNTLDFLYDNQKAIEAITGKKLPPESNKKEIETYLKNHAILIFYTIGQIEEKFGSVKFPRFKINDLSGKYTGSRYNAGYYRFVLTTILTKEINLAVKELLKLKGKTCGNKTYTFTGGEKIKGKPQISGGIKKETTLRPVNKETVKTNNGSLKKTDNSKNKKIDRTRIVVPK